MTIVDPDERTHDVRYREYELEPVHHASIKEIKRCLTHGYKKEEHVREHINYLEDLCQDVEEALSAERSQGYNNQTLAHDLRTIKDLMQRLGQALDEMDA